MVKRWRPSAIESPAVPSSRRSRRSRNPPSFKLRSLPDSSSACTAAPRARNSAICAWARSTSVSPAKKACSSSACESLAMRRGMPSSTRLIASVRPLARFSRCAAICSRRAAKASSAASRRVVSSTRKAGCAPKRPSNCSMLPSVRASASSIASGVSARASRLVSDCSSTVSWAPNSRPCSCSSNPSRRVRRVARMRLTSAYSEEVWPSSVARCCASVCSKLAINSDKPSSDSASASSFSPIGASALVDLAVSTAAAASARPLRRVAKAAGSAKNLSARSPMRLSSSTMRASCASTAGMSTCACSRKLVSSPRLRLRLRMASVKSSGAFHSSEATFDSSSPTCCVAAVTAWRAACLLRSNFSKASSASRPLRPSSATSAAILPTSSSTSHGCASTQRAASLSRRS